MDQRIVALWRQADADQSAGRFTEAEQGFRAIIGLTDGNPHPIDRLAQILRDQGRLEEAARHAADAVRAAPQELVFHNTMASIADRAGDLGLARKAYQRVLLIEPRVPAWTILGGVMHRSQDFAAAERNHGRALAIEPANPGVLLALGTAALATGDSDRAKVCFDNVLRGDPLHLIAMRNQAVLAADSGNQTDAETWLRRALVVSPGETPLLRQLGVHTLNRGDPNRAFKIHRWVVRLEPGSEESWLAMAGAGVSLSPDRASPGGLRDLTHCMVRGDVEAYRLIGPLVALLRQDKDLAEAVDRLTTRSVDELAREIAHTGWPKALNLEPLRLIMGLSVIPDPSIEIALTSIRAALLRMLAQTEPVAETSPPTLDPWVLALAEQCQINEFVFVETEQERTDLAELPVRLRNRPISRLDALVLACYGHHDMADRIDDPLVRDFRERYVETAEQERAIAADIPAITAIEDQISQSVRDQYEENPYPRWLRLPPSHPQPLRTALTRRFPSRGDDFASLSPRPDILIAGCGTGQQALSAAGRFADARILAVDLSRASLGYAERMRRSLGVTSVRFAQADILSMAGRAERFDLIEAVGVLHHMADPVAGWRALRDLLKPGGVMQIGLYSEIARQPVVRAQNLIETWDLPDGADGIGRRAGG